MKHHPDCPECVRLWREYAAATTEHFRRDGKLRIAALRHEEDLVEDLTRIAESASAAREALREAIRRHEEAAHPESAAADHV